MIRSIADFAPAGVEAGVGLALQDEAGRYLFFLAGSRHHGMLAAGELFFAGIGGHLEPGEDWLACAQREAMEEVGAGVAIQPAETTWYVDQLGAVTEVTVNDAPRPLALYEMIHPPGAPRAGQLYRIVIYRARLAAPPQRLAPDEVSGLIALTRQQVAQASEGKATLAELISGGAGLVTEGAALDLQTRVYPIGTAAALSRLLRLVDLP